MTDAEFDSGMKDTLAFLKQAQHRLESMLPLPAPYEPVEQTEPKYRPAKWPDDMGATAQMYQLNGVKFERTISGYAEFAPNPWLDQRGNLFEFAQVPVSDATQGEEEKKPSWALKNIAGKSTDFGYYLHATYGVGQAQWSIWTGAKRFNTEQEAIDFGAKHNLVVKAVDLDQPAKMVGNECIEVPATELPTGEDKKNNYSDQYRDSFHCNNYVAWQAYEKPSPSPAVPVEASEAVANVVATDVTEGEEEPDSLDWQYVDYLIGRVIKMCNKREWSLHWTARGAYLHLESSELIEAIRGKHGNPTEEAGDVLMVLMSITAANGIEWDSVLAAMEQKLCKLESSGPYRGEERIEPSPSPAVPEGEAETAADKFFDPLKAWCPEVCPITFRPFFLWMHHPGMGWVPTYGGPYDSYTIPTPDLPEKGSGPKPFHEIEFSCLRYDHDEGGWRTDEVEDPGMRVISDSVLVELEDKAGLLDKPIDPSPSSLPSIDWDSAPEWAKWHAMDDDGTEYWYSAQPLPGFNRWREGGHYLKHQWLGQRCQGWQDSLQQRPSKK